MAYQNIINTSAFTKTGPIYHVHITVNTGFTGTITVLDTNGSLSRPVAVITTPAAGAQFDYWDLQYGLSVTSSAVGDITVNYQSRNRAS